MQMLSRKKERNGGERPLVSPHRRSAGGCVFRPSAPQEAECQHQQGGQQGNPAPVQGGEEKGKPPLAGPEEGGQDARKQEKSPAAEKQAPTAAGVHQLFFAEQHGGQKDQQHHGCQLPPRDGQADVVHAGLKVGGEQGQPPVDSSAIAQVDIHGDADGPCAPEPRMGAEQEAQDIGGSSFEA